MPRGRKRKVEFVPQAWIPNSSSEDEHHEELPHLEVVRQPQGLGDDRRQELPRLEVVRQPQGLGDDRHQELPHLEVVRQPQGLGDDRHQELPHLEGEVPGEQHDEEQLNRGEGKF